MMKRKFTYLFLLTILCAPVWLVAQESFTLTYSFDSDGTPTFTDGAEITPAVVAFGGNRLGEVTYVADGTASALQAPIIQNNATNFGTNFIQMDVLPTEGFNITVDNIKITHRSDEVDNTNFFRIGCSKNGAQPGNQNREQSTINLPLSETYIESSFVPGETVNSTQFAGEYVSAFLCARGDTDTTFNWFIDEVEITGTYEVAVIPQPDPVTFSLEDFRGSQITNWGWDLKGSSVNDAQAPVYYGTSANIIRYPLLATAHAEDGTVDTAAYQGSLDQLKNLLDFRPDVEVFVSLKLDGPTTFPTWIDSEEDGEIFGNTVKKPDPDKYSDLIIQFFDFMNQEEITISYFAPGNEVPGALDPERHYETMQLVREKLALNNLSNDFKIIGPDAFTHTETQNFMNEYVQIDPNLEYIDILGTHYYFQRGDESTWASFKATYNKPVWHTEAGFQAVQENGSVRWPSMASARKRLTQFFDALNGSASNIIYWQGAGNTNTNVLAYLKVNLIDYVFGYQSVVSDTSYNGQLEDPFTLPVFQAFRNGRKVIIFAINPRLSAIEGQEINFDKAYDIGTVSKEVLLAEDTGFGYTRTLEDINFTEMTDTITADYPANSTTIYQFELPDELFELNNAPVVRNSQEFEYAPNYDNTGDIVGKILADDADANELTYSLVESSLNEAFEIGANSGLITLSDPAILEASGESTIYLEVSVNDGKIDSAMETVAIQIEDTTLSVDELSNTNAAFNIYPNPSTAYLNITGEDIQAFSIVNMTGRQVLAGQAVAKGELTINVKELNAGMYMLKTTISGRDYYKKIIIK